MAILQSDASGLAVTDNSGNALLRTSGSILQTNWGSTSVTTTIPPGSTWTPTALQASITSTRANSKFLIQAHTSTNFYFNVAGSYLDLYVSISGGGYSSISGAGGSNYGFAGGSMRFSASGTNVVGKPPSGGCSFAFFYGPSVSSGTNMTFKVYAKNTTANNISVGDPDRLMLSTIIVQEVA